MAVGSPATAAEPTTAWSAGVAKVDITPKSPVWMAGYASRNSPSDGVLVPLAARALALKDAAGHRLVVVTLEILETPDSLQTRIAEVAREQHGLRPEELLLNVSHTHGGPMLSARNVADWGIDAAWGDRAEEYAATLVSQVDRLIGTALSKLKPATVRNGQSRCGFAMNRRLPTAEGMRMGPNPDGVTDHEVPVLRVDAADGSLLAVMFGYACHNTALGDIRQLHGDYAGLTQRRVETTHPQTVALFLLGCGGDQDPHPRRNLQDAERNAESLARAVEEGLESASPPLSATLHASRAACPLPFQKLPPRAELEARAQSGNGFVSRHAQSILRQWPNPDDQPSDYQLPVHVLRLGGTLTLVALGGEPVADYAHRIRKELRKEGETIWVAGYSNRINAYLPSRRVLEEGGYEGTEAIIYQALPAPFALDVEERVVESVVRQARQCAAAAGAAIQN
ncbi:MAG: neutral/alkaline non-lysosomal ceramidase N-terminal domain-containing protein [Planctomycetaceae bacterium]|jgi:hypothetical protein